MLKESQSVVKTQQIMVMSIKALNHENTANPNHDMLPIMVQYMSCMLLPSISQQMLGNHKQFV